MNLKLSMCRTCLVRISEKNVFNIYNTRDLAKKLMLCSGLPIETTDEYPENVCPQCYEKILLFYEFQQMCFKSLDTLNELLETKETAETEGRKVNEQSENEVRSLLCRDFNNLREATVKHSSNKNVLINILEKRKRGSPSKKKLKEQKVETKRTIRSSNRTAIRKSINTSDLNNELVNTSDFTPFDKESVDILQINSSFSKEKEAPEKSPMRTDSCSSLHGLIFPHKQNHFCKHCKKSFNAVHKLEAHLRNHDLPPYICALEGCQRTFNSWNCYNKHKKEHEQIFKCDLDHCERIYKNKSALNIHKRKFHNIGPELKRHMCEICGKVFKSSAVLNDHHYTHIDKTQLPYACEEVGCAKRFSNKEKLKVHKMRHAGIKNFICPHCGMRKTTRNELKIHINYHTHERTWACRFCPKVCNSAGNLKMHVKNMHEGAKDFACRYCEKTFAKADTKKYHEMTHTGEKPHECKECGRRFVQPAALRTHRKIHLRQKENSKHKAATVSEDIKNCVKEADEAKLISESMVNDILSDTNEILD